MKYCIHCGSEMSDEAEFCEKCGKAAKKVSGEKATKKPLIIGCSIGIVLVSIIVVSLFATGVFGGKDETVQTSADVKPTQTVSDAENTTKEAGLYDSDGKMIKTWEELQLEEFIDLDDGDLYSSTETRTLQGQLVIKEGVTSIGDSAFCECSGLTSIAIPDSVTSIEDSAFRECSSLTSIAIPDSVTSIGDNAFFECSNLISIAIPDSVTSIERGVLSGCSRLERINVDEKNTKYDSRDGCNAVIETESNKLICGCQNTIIPDSVTSIGGLAFNKCSSLTSITIPEGVTSIESAAFCECSSLTSIAIPDSVTSIEDSVFSGCSSLTSIAIPDGVTSIGVYAFRDVPLVLYDGNRTWDWGLSGVESVEKSDGTVLYP